jgi:hypothetical protein
MRILHIAAVLALFEPIALAHAGAPKATLGGYGHWAKVRPVQDALHRSDAIELPRHIGPNKCRRVLT